ncbi:hypothetical protein ALC57_10488 [Trachymyrmex cornetzi]|uniref:Uncharacterized protein n=1 Tax=Trachymyrmex cornetzi TaxID=471704 RepID=A0A195DWK1_9HYME|nr:hypothetical protein ALC57_10488 [Trachymyrmex cornetzi]
MHTLKSFSIHSAFWEQFANAVPSLKLTDFQVKRVVSTLYPGYILKISLVCLKDIRTSSGGLCCYESAYHSNRQYRKYLLFKQHSNCTNCKFTNLLKAPQTQREEEEVEEEEEEEGTSEHNLKDDEQSYTQVRPNVRDKESRLFREGDGERARDTRRRDRERGEREIEGEGVGDREMGKELTGKIERRRESEGGAWWTGQRRGGPGGSRVRFLRLLGRSSLDRRPPGAAGAVAGLGLRERAAQSNLNRRARPTRGHRRSLSLPPVSRDTRDTRGASCVYAACDTRYPITRRRDNLTARKPRRATIFAREETISRARARKKEREIKRKKREKG